MVDPEVQPALPAQGPKAPRARQLSKIVNELESGVLRQERRRGREEMKISKRKRKEESSEGREEIEYDWPPAFSENSSTHYLIDPAYVYFRR